MEGGSSRNRQTRLPEGYIGQHTLWTRNTFRSQQYSNEWHQHPGMVLFMPATDEQKLHTEFVRMPEYRQYQSGLPLPSRELARLSMAYLNGTDPDLGRKKRFERMASYMRDIADSTNGRHAAAEAELYAGHFALQLDFYGNVLTAKEERENGLI